MQFYLGTHLPNWLRHTDKPLFISSRRLVAFKTLPRAAGRWALDSGAFTEISTHGRWITGPEEYVANVRWYADEIGNLDWAAPQDWMCEPEIVAKTGLSVAEHQRRTIDNYLELKSLWPDGPFIPALQGWGLKDYLEHVEMYSQAGLELAEFPVVLLGSVCRRQGTQEAEEIVEALSGLGISLHGLGFKVGGIQRCRSMLVSSDSMAWSFAARRMRIQLEGCTHQNCANCFKWAMRWYDNVAAVSEGRPAKTLRLLAEE